MTGPIDAASRHADDQAQAARDRTAKLARAGEAGRTTRSAAAAHPDSAAIVAALPLRPRAGLYIGPAPDTSGNLTVLERDEDPDDGSGESIVGLAIRGDDGWYLGCIGCRDGISEADGGMCRPCREDLARQDQMYLRDEPDEPLPAPGPEDC
jgi:hypothetical protein